MQDIALIKTHNKKEFEKEICIGRDFVNIFEAYYRRVYNYVFYRVGSHHEAEDLTSMVFEKMMLKIETYDKDKSPFEVWMFSIARNVINDHFRKSQRQNFFSFDSIKNIIFAKENPEHVLETKETKDELIHAVSLLDKREQNIIALKYGANLKNIEIAKILDLTESNIGVILYRAMRKLKKELGGK